MLNYNLKKEGTGGGEQISDTLLEEGTSTGTKISGLLKKAGREMINLDYTSLGGRRGNKGYTSGQMPITGQVKAIQRKGGSGHEFLRGDLRSQQTEMSERGRTERRDYFIAMPVEGGARDKTYKFSIGTGKRWGEVGERG